MIEVNNLTHFVVSKSFFMMVAKKVLKGENREKENLSIAFVSPEEITKLNKKFREKDKPTDVLSFEKTPRFSAEMVAKGLGTSDFNDGCSEVVICPFIVRKNATGSHLSFKKELANILIHGLLHILGYDHEKSEKENREMEKRQAYYLAQV